MKDAESDPSPRRFCSKLGMRKAAAKASAAGPTAKIHVSNQLFAKEKYQKPLFGYLRGFACLVFSRDLRLSPQFESSLFLRLVAVYGQYFGTIYYMENHFEDVIGVRASLSDVNYLADDGIAGIVYLADRLGKPFLVEGPAGTGKTYTGVAIAVKALKNKEVKRIILTRPAVEAGENLGFLPGDLKDKLDPYMQPLYDALKDMIPQERLDDYIKRGIIEIAPLAYMRGRTLDDAFVILDEAQNTTKNQMKMFLTRMGKKAKFMITGDPGQIDLPKLSLSGLKTANNILQRIEGIEIIYLDGSDVIRHKLVTSIIDAYNKNENI